MATLRDIMSSDMITMSPQTTIREAMELLAAHHVSGAPVVGGGTLVGVVSASDLMAFAGALSGVPSDSESEAEWVETLEPLPVSDQESDTGPAGAYFSDLWEDAGAELTSRFESVGGPEWNALEEHDVSEVMTRLPVVTLSPDASVEDAADLMRDAKIHRVLLIEDDKLVGIVTTFDIATRVGQSRQDVSAIP